MSDNQITAFNPGALAAGSRDAINRVSTEGNNFFAIIAPGNIKDMENYAQFYKKANIKYIFDPGQQITALSSVSLKSGIKGAEILIGNDYEISLISKKTGWTIKDLIDKVEMLVLTMGDKGSLIYYNKKKHIIGPAKVKKALDPTGAGDAYRAGLIKGIIKGYNIKKCGQLASVVASFAVERIGTQKHYFRWREIETRYKNNYGENL
jgi:adenosine kinase